MNDLFVTQLRSPNHVKVDALRGKFAENEWKYQLFVMKGHDIITDASIRDIVSRYAEYTQLAEYHGVYLPALKKVSPLTPCQIATLCKRIDLPWHSDVIYCKVNKNEFLTMNNPMGGII